MTGRNSNKRTAEPKPLNPLAPEWRPGSTQSRTAATSSDKGKDETLERSMSSMNKQSISSQVVQPSGVRDTHFISLPLAINPPLVDKLRNFQNSILRINDTTTDEATSSTSKSKTLALSELRIDESIFTKPELLHLTVLMLKLWTKDRVDAAIEIFKGIQQEISDALEGEPVVIKLEGLVKVGLLRTTVYMFTLTNHGMTNIINLNL